MIYLASIDILHSKCLETHLRSFPPHTAPAGYTCPTCSTPVSFQHLLFPIVDLILTHSLQTQRSQIYYHVSSLQMIERAQTSRVLWMGELLITWNGFPLESFPVTIFCPLDALKRYQWRPWKALCVCVCVCDTDGQLILGAHMCQDSNCVWSFYQYGVSALENRTCSASAQVKLRLFDQNGII